MKLLEIKNLKKHFKGNEVLKDVSLDVEEGEVVVILGPSGSGKSTLLRCATMLETMDGGSLTLCGMNAAREVDGKLQYADKRELTKIRNSFGMVFQNFNLFPHYTALKNVYDAPVSVLKQNKAEAIENAKQLLTSLGLKDRMDNYPCQLSGGQQQRVAIARALAMNPQIIFFDEPTSALDPELTAGILKIMKEIASQKKTMVIVTHEIDFARNVADRVIFMDGGVIVEQGSAKDVIDNPSNERTKAFLNRLS